MTYNPSRWYRERDAEICRVCEQDGIEAAVNRFHMARTTIRMILRHYGATRGMRERLVRMGGER